jgi:hypothetical protein
VLDNEEKKSGFGGSVKPLRLDKKSETETSTEAEPKRDREETEESDEPTTTAEKGSEVNSAPMSFEDAVAAGLVPPGILDRESKGDS